MNVRILTNIPDVSNHTLDQAANGVEGSLRYIASWPSQQLKELYPGAFNKVYNFKAIDVVLGTKSPDIIKKTAENWNKTNSMRVINEIKYIENEAQEFRCNSISSYLKAIMNTNGCFREMHYPASVENLRKALDAVNNIYSYGSEAMVAVDLCYKNYSLEERMVQGVYLGDPVTKYIEKHPKEYMILTLSYSQEDF